MESTIMGLYRVWGLGFRPEKRAERPGERAGIDFNGLGCGAHHPQANSHGNPNPCRPYRTVNWVAVKELKLSYHNGYI